MTSVDFQEWSEKEAYWIWTTNQAIHKLLKLTEDVAHVGLLLSIWILIQDLVEPLKWTKNDDPEPST